AKSRQIIFCQILVSYSFYSGFQMNEQEILTTGSTREHGDNICLSFPRARACSPWLITLFTQVKNAVGIASCISLFHGLKHQMGGETIAHYRILERLIA